jgi:hypothetical protein
MKHALVPGAVPLAQELPLRVINAGGVVNPSQLARALENARQIWRLAGIEIAQVPGASLDESLQAEVANVVIDAALGSDSASLAKLLQLAPSTTQEGLPLLLVQDIVLVNGDETQGSLWAVSGGIPVPPVQNTPRSGLAVSAELLKQDPQYAGQVIAHEIGHALGLFHSTEARLIGRSGQTNVAIHDGFTDTPNCPAQADRDGDRVLTASECRSFDANNLMFWGTQQARPMWQGEAC